MFFSIPVQEYPGLIKVRCQFERSKGSEVAVVTSHALSVRYVRVHLFLVCLSVPSFLSKCVQVKGPKTVENVSHATGNPSLTSMKSRRL